MGFPVRYPFTFGVGNEGGTQGGGVATPDYQITLLDGPERGEAGIFTGRISYRDTQGRSGRSFASQRIWYPEGFEVPGADSNWTYLDWAEHDAAWQRLTGIGTGGGLGELSSTRREFYAECSTINGWLYIDGFGGVFGDTSTAPAAPILTPVSVPEGGAQAWASVSASSDGFLRVGTPQADVTIEVYAPNSLTTLVQTEGDLQLLAPASTAFVPVTKERTYYLRMVSSGPVLAPVQLIYSDPETPLPTTIPATVAMPLAWNPPVQDGGLPVTGYTVFTLLGGKTKRTKVGAQLRSATLQLRPGAVIWIVANNAAGASEPLLSGRVV